jgi:excisionase family DNA binding protein
MSGLALPLPPELLDHLAAQVAEHLAARMTPLPQPYMNVDDAAEYLACGKRRIYDLVERGTVACYRDGKRLLFRREDLDTYVSAPDSEFARA